MRHAGKERKGSGGARLSRPARQISPSISRVSASSPLEDRVHRDDVERRIAPQRPERNARVLVDVAFADLDEAAELREAREPHRDRLGGERIENDVHAAPVGQFHDGFGKIAAARVDHMLHAERLEQRAFGRAARAGDDFRAEVMRDLDRRHADAARARVDEDAFALAQARHILERMPRSHEDHRQRRRFLERQVARNAADITAARQRLRGEAEHREAKHAIARRDVLHARRRRP